MVGLGVSTLETVLCHAAPIGMQSGVEEGWQVAQADRQADQSAPSLPDDSETGCHCMHSFPGRVAVIITTATVTGTYPAAFNRSVRLLSDRTASPPLPPPIA